MEVKPFGISGADWFSRHSGTADPLEAVDPWTVWRCASEPLRPVLRRDRERIVCPELGTAHPARAA